MKFSVIVTCFGNAASALGRLFLLSQREVMFFFFFFSLLCGENKACVYLNRRLCTNIATVYFRNLCNSLFIRLVMSFFFYFFMATLGLHVHGRLFNLF